MKKFGAESKNYFETKFLFESGAAVGVAITPCAISLALQVLPYQRGSRLYLV